ncbi:hypothetical protein WJX81_007476 [Elliptochloris bilobata]|uniref:Glycosyl hydrolase n=1 Tax=Elliptochloris bilobata TaxID=381761 RepID=A0AAW1RCJ4_9CHLO
MEHGWMPAVVPGTVLTNLVRNGTYHDPNIGATNLHIPDVYHAGRCFYTYWFSTNFSLPLNATAGQRARLTFRGINYSARVFVNGREVALAEPKGMFLRRRVDITEQLAAGHAGPQGLREALESQNATLAVLVAPPDNVGDVDMGGQGGDHLIARDVTALFTEGWDWMQPVRDRDTGIFDSVELKVTGPVALEDPHVAADQLTGLVPGSPAAASARLRTAVTLINAGSATLRGVLFASVAEAPHSGLREGAEPDAQQAGPPLLQWREDVVVPPGSTLHTLRPQLLASPRVWWPLHLGDQALYQLTLRLELEGGTASDSVAARFGVREIRSEIDPVLNGHVFHVNGQRVFIRGGNWIATDWMLRWSVARYRTEVRMHAEAGLNMIRIWGGAAVARDAFYVACDEAGVLVWQEFWIAGDTHGRGNTTNSPISNASWPLDHRLFVASAADTIRRLRNHACLALWCGGNEQVPAPDLNAVLRKLLPTAPGNWLDDTPSDGASSLLDNLQALDATRSYVPGSLWAGLANGRGNFTDGPYEIQEPERFFRPDFYNYSFNPELGSVGVPEADTMRIMFLDPGDAEPPSFHTLTGQDSADAEEVPNPAWVNHTFMPYGQPNRTRNDLKLHPYTRNQIWLYSQPGNLQEYCDAAQIVNYVQYRALLEGWASGMWLRYSGMVIWKTQNPWAGLRGQLYDWLLAQTGGFYGARAACETTHVQLNLHTLQAEVVNQALAAQRNLTMEVAAFAANVTAVPAQNATQGALNRAAATQRFTLAEAPPASVTNVSGWGWDPLAQPGASNATAAASGTVWFVFLWLRRADGSLLSRNAYWLPQRPDGDFRSLSAWGSAWPATVAATAASGVACGSSRCNATVSLNNTSPAVVAFWIKLALVDECGDGCAPTRVLPAFYSDNFLTLAPREVVAVALDWSAPLRNTTRLQVSGWNVGPQTLALQAAVAAQ